MDLFSPRHLLIILLIVLVVFGTKKLKSIGSDLGGAVRGFKSAMNQGEAEATQTETPAEAPRIATTVPPAAPAPDTRAASTSEPAAPHKG